MLQQQNCGQKNQPLDLNLVKFVSKHEIGGGQQQTWTTSWVVNNKHEILSLQQ